jgi:hypothetical protein
VPSYKPSVPYIKSLDRVSVFVGKKSESPREWIRDIEKRNKQCALSPVSYKPINRGSFADMKSKFFTPKQKRDYIASLFASSTHFQSPSAVHYSPVLKDRVKNFKLS